jgi:hypothetical protein
MAMFDEIRSKRRRGEAAGRGTARYGEATGRRDNVEPRSRAGSSVSFSSQGLALIGLRRRDRRPPGAKSAAG